MGSTKIATSLFIFMAVTALLIVGKDFILPIILAVLIWFLIKELRHALQKIPIIGTKMPMWLLTLISTIFLFAILGVIISVLAQNFNALSQNAAKYENSLVHLNETIKSKYGWDFSSQITKFIGNYNFSDIIKQVLNSLSELFSKGLLIGFYVLFLFFEEIIFPNKLKAIYTDEKRYKEVLQTLEKINTTITKYISLKTLVSLLTGFLSFIVLLIIGVDTPFFWAFLIFILNYIPTIGSLIATIFPATIALLQFGDLTHFFITLSVIGLIQIIIGNVVEPKFLGNSLNISSLVVMFSLTFWGMIWGVTGMFLSVPITVILIILLAQFKTTKPIAILLSDKGKV
jgi:predicted PurR-regulated permease PerM